MNAIVSVNYYLIGEKAADLYQEVGKNYEDTVIVNNIQQAFKSTSARYTAEEIVTKRTELADSAKTLLQEAIDKYYIVVQDFNVTDVQFSPEYDESIEQKQVQEQKVEIAKLKKQEAVINAETITINAQAEADAQEILNKTGALSSSYLQYLFLTNWNGQLPSVIGGADPVFDIYNYIGEGE